MDCGKTDNERELTSTMGNVLSVSIKDEKNDTSGSDATPTSSTDANTTTTSSRIVSDDPISSTSSDVVELNRSRNLEDNIQSSVEINQVVMDEPDKSSVDAETDLLDISISSVSRERITEDVEDLVHDLESLLGESTDSFNIPIKRREDQKSPTVKDSTPSEKGDTVSLEDPGSSKNVEIILDSDKVDDETVDANKFSLREESETTEEKGKEGSLLCNVNEAEKNESIEKIASSDTEKELSIDISSEPKTDTFSENLLEEIPDGTKIDPEIKNIEVCKSVGDAECITASEEITLDDVKDGIKDATKDDEVATDNIKDSSKDDEVATDNIKDATKDDEVATDDIKDATKDDEVVTDNIKDSSKDDEVATDNIKDVTKVDEVGTDNIKDATKDDEVATDNIKDSSKDDEVATDNIKDESNDDEVATDNIKDATKDDKVVTDNIKYSSKDDEVATDNIKDESKDDEVATDNIKDASKDDEVATNNIKDKIKDDEVTTDNSKDTSNDDEVATENIKDASKDDKVATDNIKDASKDDEVATDIIKDEGKDDEVTTDNIKDVSKEDEVATDNIKDASKGDEVLTGNSEDMSKDDDVTTDNIKDGSNDDDVSTDNIKDASKDDEVTTDNIKDASAVVQDEEQPEKVCDQPMEEEQMNAEDSALEYKVQDEESKKETDQSEVILVVSSSDIQKGEVEQTDEANICLEDNISRDIKTDIIESVDSECKESESSMNKESATNLDDQIEVQKDVNEDNSDSPQEIKEVEEVVQDVHCEISNDTDSKLQDLAIVQSISENSNQDQVELHEQVDVAPAEEIEGSAFIALTQESDKHVPEEADENCESIITEEPGNHQIDVPEEIIAEEEAKDQSNLPNEEVQNSDLDTACEIESYRNLSEDVEPDSGDAQLAARTCDVKSTSELDTDSKRNYILKKDAVSEVEESQENIPQALNAEIVTESISIKMVENIEDVPVTSNTAVIADDTHVEVCVQSDLRSPIKENTAATAVSESVAESTFVSETDLRTIQENETETEKEAPVQSGVDKSEVANAAEQTTVIAISERGTNKEDTENIAPVHDLQVEEINILSNMGIDQGGSIDEQITDTLFPQLEKTHTYNDTTDVELEVNIPEKCEESMPEQIPIAIEELDDVQQLSKELCLATDECSYPQQQKPLSPKKIEDHNVTDVIPDEHSKEEQTRDLNEVNLVTVESTEQEIPAIIESVEVISSQVDEIHKFSIVTSAYSETKEIVEPGEVASAEVADNSQLESNISALEEVSIDNKQDHVLQWVGDLAPIENEGAGNSSEVIENDDAESKMVEMLDEDSKIMVPEAESLSFFSQGNDSDSEDTVPTLVLEPDEIVPSPEPAGSEKEMDQTNEPLCVVNSTIDTDIPDKLPEIEEILNDQGNVDDVVENIDMQENLETILAVASLQNVGNADVAEVAVESQMSDEEIREMEALRKAVESITETTETAEYSTAEQMSELIKNIDQSVSKTEFQTDKKTQEGTIMKDQIDSEEKTVQSSVNKSELAEDTVEENDLKQATSQAEDTLPDTSEDKINVRGTNQEVIDVLPDSSQSILISEEGKLTEYSKEKESKNKVNERSKRQKKSIADTKYEELSINVDVPEREKPYSPKITIKPIKVPDEEVSTTSYSDIEVGKGSLKMTITKQFDKMHSVLKICESDSSEPTQEQDEPIPKLIIKPKMQQVEQQHSPKMSTRSSKQMYSPTSSTQRSGSPRITIKPVVKPDKVESVSPLKIKIKPEEVSKRHSPKLTIKPVAKPDEESRENIQSPRKVTIKPVKTPEELEQTQNPRITIKPIPKPEVEKDAIPVSPRLNIKPIKRDEEELDIDRERSSPKITIKPVKPPEPDTQISEPDDAVKERIVLKINKGNLPTPTKESKKREHPPDDEKSEKLAKITVKFSKGGGHPHIVQQTDETNKRPHEEHSPERAKKQKLDTEASLLTRSKHKDITADSIVGDTSKIKQKEIELHSVETRSKHTHPTTEPPIEAKRIKLKDTPETSKQRESTSEAQRSRTNNDYSDDVKIIETKLDSPIVISEDSRSQDSGSCIIIEDRKDPLAGVPTYDIAVKTTTETPIVVPITQESVTSTPTASVTPTPRKRGRPRKVPIVVREDFKDQDEPKPEPKKEEPPQLVHESGRPKRSCRGQSVRATLGIKPRKPRGPGRGRGSKRGMGTRIVPMKPEGLSK